MSGRKNMAIFAGFVLSFGLLASSLLACFLTNYYNRISFQMLGEICQEVIEKQPEAEQAVLSVLKEYRYKSTVATETNIMLAYGYRPTDFLPLAGKYGVFFVVMGFGISGILFLVTFLFWHKKEIGRIRGLTNYLEKVNAGGEGLLFQTEEDDFSGLQDEIYKTVTMLHQTRDAAVSAKNNFAENLSNIAHQIKTPLTAVSLSIQMMQDNPSPKYLEQMNQQLLRLTHLEEALLLLSRMDAGTLLLEKKEVDVFTLLMLAADNLQELFREAGVTVHIPESGEMMIYADLDWTMEAIMNLFKNCMEHTPPGGVVYCAYEQNPLYTQIRIWDRGTGFAKDDIPHIFKRFYRGQNAVSGSIGIGLALAKEIIERQNGTISAQNLTDGGACFEIRIYSH